MQSPETAWSRLRALAPVKEPVCLVCSDGVRRWILPPGIASGCEFTEQIKTYPRANYSRGPRYLWQQEEYIFRLEMSDAVRRAVAQLNELFPLKTVEL
jgi:hypothetical protein